MAEDARAAAVRQEQRREQPDERRLPRAVLARGWRCTRRARISNVSPRKAADARALAPVLPDELLAQVVYFNGVHRLLLRLRNRTRTQHPRLKPGARGKTCQPKSNIESPRLADVSAGAQIRRGRGPTGAGLDSVRFISELPPRTNRADDTEKLTLVRERPYRGGASPPKAPREGNDASELLSEPWGFFCWTDAMEIRAMRTDDWPAVKAIYEQGIATRQATFETEAPGWEAWDAGHLAEPRLVAERSGAGRRLGGALAGLAPERLRGRGRVEHLRGRDRARPGDRPAAPRASSWPRPTTPGSGRSRPRSSPRTSPASRCTGACGFRVVGMRERIAQLDGAWRDTVLMERRAT